MLAVIPWGILAVKMEKSNVLLKTFSTLHCGMLVKYIVIPYVLSIN